MGNLVRTPRGGFRWRVNLKAIEASLPSLCAWQVDGFDAEHGSARFGGNTLFVAGGRSSFLRSSHLPAIERCFERFALQSVRNADHWIRASDEGAKALLLITSNFLRVPSQ